MLRFILLVTALNLSSPGRTDPGAMETNRHNTADFTVLASADRCMAVATFQNGSESLRLGIEARPTTEAYYLILEARGDARGKNWEVSEATLGSHKLASRSVVTSRSARPGTMLYRLRTDRAELSSAGDGSTLVMRSESLNASIPISGLGAALASLDACSSNLLATWGFSKAQQADLASFPEPEKSLSTYAHSWDYPPSALRARFSGDAHTLVMVAADGKASDCRVVRTSGNKDVDQMTCTIATKRVRFIPAKAKRGENVTAPAYVAMRWEVPQQ